MGSTTQTEERHMNMYAVLQGEYLLSQWYPTQDQALFEAYSLGLVYRNKRTDKLYLPHKVRIVHIDEAVDIMSSMISTSKRMANLIKKISKG